MTSGDFISIYIPSIHFGLVLWIYVYIFNPLCTIQTTTIEASPQHDVGHHNMISTTWLLRSLGKPEEVKIYHDEFKSRFSSWVEEYPRIERALWKSSSQVHQLLAPLYIYIYIYNYIDEWQIGKGLKV